MAAGLADSERSHPRLCRFVAGLCLVATSLPSCLGAAAPSRAAPPGCDSQELASAADQLAKAFDEHPFVFLGSTQGDRKQADFLLCLLSRPALQERATDILVEWANPVHQALMDRYLVALEEIPEEALTPIWFDTDAPELWARLPLIPEFFRGVRELNRDLEPARRIRVLGGSEPVDWSAVTTIDAPGANLVRQLGDPERPFYSPASRSLNPARVESGVSFRHWDGLVYLGPTAGPNLAHTVELTEVQRNELNRRTALQGDLRTLLQLRLQRRDLWFQNHPSDLPERLPSHPTDASRPLSADPKQETP